MPVLNQTTAFVNENFATTGILGTSLYEADSEPRVRAGTAVMLTNNKKAVYCKAHAALAAAAACAVAADGMNTAAGATSVTVVALALGQFGWIVSNTAAV
jgi:hypothetical protein